MSRNAGDANFAATLTDRARAHAGATALIEPAGRGPGGRSRWRSISYGDLDTLATRYARGFTRVGVRRGDRVLYLLRPSIRGYAAFYALLRLGAVPILLDPRMGLRSLLACIEAVGPTVVLAVPLVHAVRVLVRRPFAAARVLVTDGRRWFWGGARLADCARGGGDLSASPTAPHDPSFLPFTSGATGTAKGVFYDHGLMRNQATMMRLVCGWHEGMRIVLCYAPFVPYALADGLTVILPDMDFSRPATAAPGRIVDALVDHRAECAFGSPIIWVRLVRYCARKGLVLSALQRAVTAGAPVPARLHRQLEPILGAGGRLYTPYGATEAMPLTTAHTGELAETWERTRRGEGTCVGRPLAGIDVWIIRVTDEPVPEWGEALRVPTGEIGEIVVGGPVVSPEYPLSPDETAKAKIRWNGRILHRTGDLGRLDTDGRLWFCGRKADRILTRQGMLPSLAIENIFNEHPAVFRTAVVGVGVPGAMTPVACVEMEDGAAFSSHTVADLRTLADGTSYAGVVDRFLCHPGFPVDARHNSKIRRDVLAAWATRVLSRGGA